MNCMFKWVSCQGCELHLSKGAKKSSKKDEFKDSCGLGRTKVQEMAAACQPGAASVPQRTPLGVRAGGAVPAPPPPGAGCPHRLHQGHKLPMEGSQHLCPWLADFSCYLAISVRLPKTRMTSFGISANIPCYKPCWFPRAIGCVRAPLRQYLVGRTQLSLLFSRSCDGESPAFRCHFLPLPGWLFLEVGRDSFLSQPQTSWEIVKLLVEKEGASGTGETEMRAPD